jgi:hypothetical protein
MLGREEGIVDGVEGSSDSDAPSVHKKAEEGNVVPATEIK